MKSHTRRVAVILVVVVFLQMVPPALAAPRDERSDFGTKVVRVIKAIQRFLNLVPDDDAPQPPRP